MGIWEKYVLTIFTCVAFFATISSISTTYWMEGELYSSHITEASPVMHLGLFEVCIDRTKCRHFRYFGNIQYHKIIKGMSMIAFIGECVVILLAVIRLCTCHHKCFSKIRKYTLGTGLLFSSVFLLGVIGTYQKSYKMTVYHMELGKDVLIVDVVKDLRYGWSFYLAVVGATIGLLGGCLSLYVDLKKGKQNKVLRHVQLIEGD